MTTAIDAMVNILVYAGIAIVLFHAHTYRKVPSTKRLSFAFLVFLKTYATLSHCIVTYLHASSFLITAIIKIHLVMPQP